MFVFPVRDGTPLPPVFTKFADVAKDPLSLPASRNRPQPGPVDRAVDHHRASVALVARPRVASALLALVPIAFFAVFFAYPVIAIVGRGLTPDGTLDLDPLREVVNDPALRHVIWFTVWQAALSTVLTVAIALPGAYMLTRYDFPGRRIVRALVTVPFVLPTVVVGTAFAALLGTGGPLADLGTRPDRLGDPDRPRVLQLRGRRADGRRSVVASRPSPGRGRADARRKPLARLSRGDASRAPSRDRDRERGRVPLHLHVVRCHPHPRRPALRDARDRDLPADCSAPEPPTRGRAHARTARSRRRAARRHRAHPGSRAGSAPAALGRRNRSPAEDGARTLHGRARTSR